MQAMRDVQRPDGRFTDVAPLGGGFGGTLWGSAGVTAAWESYQQYGDRQLLAEHYDAMKHYASYLQGRIDPKTSVLDEGPLGDWLGLEQSRNDNTLLWEAYFIYDLGILQKVATILSKTEDAQAFATLAAQRRQFFNATYVDKATGRTVHSGFHQEENSTAKPGDLIDTQASYVLPLALGAYAPENQTPRKQARRRRHGPALLAAHGLHRHGLDCPGPSRPRPPRHGLPAAAADLLSLLALPGAAGRYYRVGAAQLLHPHRGLWR
jgi:hypothetical protein